MSGLARLLQIPVLQFVKKRQILNISDWTSLHEFKKRDDTLLQNSLLPWKGFYFKYDEHYECEAEQVFPEEIDVNVLNPQRIINLIQRNNRMELDYAFVKYFCELVQFEYKKGRNIFIRAFVIFKEAYNYYKPNVVLIPGETHFAYVIAAQVAETMKIKSALVIDGYKLVVDKYIYYKNINNDKYLFSKFFAFGKAHNNILLKSGIHEKDCVLC